jgi:branched-chain amino acid aminotransferase
MLGDAERPAELRALGVRIRAGELADERAGDAGRALGIFERIRLNTGLIVLEAARGAIDEFPIFPARRKNLARDRVCERDVGADVEPQPAASPLRRRGTARIDDVKLCAVANPFQYVMEKDWMRLARVAAPKNDRVGTFGLFVRARASAGTEDRRQTDDARSVSRSVAAIDVIASGNDAREFLRCVIDFVRGLRAAEHAVRARTISRTRVRDSLRGAIERLVPGRWSQGIAVANERLGQSSISFHHAPLRGAHSAGLPPCLGPYCSGWCRATRGRLRTRRFDRCPEAVVGRNDNRAGKALVTREEIAAVDLSNTIVYARGEFCRYADAKVGLLTHGLQYGTGCFEGIRGYWVPQEEELYLVLLRDHFERLATSAKILTMKLDRSADELIEITLELCVRNRFRQDVYVRPFVYKAAEDVGVRLHNVPDALAIVPIPFTAYLDASRGLHVCVSSWRRADDTMAPPRAKITGLYVNSALAKSEAVENGYDEAILLSHDGHVAEGSAENVFVVRRGVLYTPDPSQNVLEGCTRRMIMDVAQQEFGLEVIERSIDRGELYAAEEVFFTGTAAGVAYVSSIDRRVVGDGTLGPIARRLAGFYERIVTGREPRYSHWITRAYGSSRLAAAADGIR